MHELGIAQSIVDYALSEAKARNASRVSEIHVEVGELAMIDRGILSHALRMLKTDPLMERCRFSIRKRDVSFVCRKCDAKWPMAEAVKQLGQVPQDLLVREPDSKEVPLHFLPSLYPAFVRCPKCGSADVEVTAGEDVKIMRMVFE
ncbi:MAG TPA: hydrogenase maturation nickel metallochaperone HypA [Nitrososphaerales archaeon]|nr:hydrogenase maturation nickel metallochaperone HypA [Nitrososphaerales archaeon]